MSEKSKEKLKFSAEISKVLQLMIHSLYTNRDIFIRELVSNASDACDKLRHLALTQPDLVKDAAELSINILINKKDRKISIADNGIGMNHDELVANLGTIARSGTQEFIARLTGDGKKDMPLIGQFGVGFYSSFMVADKVTVVSRRAGEEEAWQWESVGEGEFTIEPVPPPVGGRLGGGHNLAPSQPSPHPNPPPNGEGIKRGTTITLHLKEGEDAYLDKFRLRHIIQTYSDHISFPIIITDDEGSSEKVNTGAAIWMRPKSDITPEQYTEFYRHASHAADEPWLILHNKAEGKIEYTNLLFIPSVKPFDLFHPDRKRRVKLYVKRVFITEENVDLVPHYMRFLRGVVDSEDLPLNISRETLQNNPLLTKIRDSVVKRVLSELKKKSGEDAEGYNKFWANFGPVLKEGLCEATTPREQILEVCRFYSTAPSPRAGEGRDGENPQLESVTARPPLPAFPARGEGLTSLDDYISRMKPGQDTIYYLTGERIETLRSSPQIEGFAKRGIEVLLMCDHVDDFWVNVVFEYKGKKLKSATRSDIELDKVDGEKKDEKPESKAEDASVKTLCERIKEILGDKVKDVRSTDKLTNSAVCLAVEEGAMDFRLERFLVEQKQIEKSTAKILEINPDHSIIKSLISKLPDSAAKTEVEDVAWLLFDQARLVEGEAISDPAAFTRRLQSFVEKSLAA